MHPHLRLTIAIAGAGHIGCYVGGMLAAAGHSVALLARGQVLCDVETHGLRLTRYDGAATTLAADEVSASSDPACLTAATHIIVATKSRDTVAMADLIATYAASATQIISLQNGVGNLGVLRARLPVMTVLGGMVPFNVTQPAPGHFHCATSGDIVLQSDPAGTAARLSSAGLMFRSTDEIVGVQWGKLLINLGNGLNALANIPLKDQLSQRPWRRLMAAQIQEALDVLRAAGIKPTPPTPLPAALLPHVLRLPDALFQRVAKRMIDIDPTARSSMWDDVQAKRPTEIDELQGVILALAKKHTISVPTNQRVFDLIKSVETTSAGSPGLTAHQIAALAD
jgi:2-dehydropantoate 2-reductase